MLVTYLLSVGLALVAGAAPDDASTAQPPVRTLLLVQPLYPGQELVAQRAEQSIGALLPQEMRTSQLIGREALATWLEGRKVRTGCLLDKRECREPLDAWLRELGLESVVLVKGGQDGSGFRFRAVRVHPAGQRLEGEASDPHFEKALMGALVKVYSLAATVEVASTPSGATLFVDGVKLGTTPLSTQVLPGEHTFRFELASHEPLEVSQTVRALAQMKVEQRLQALRGRLIVQAEPEGTRILLDGREVGRNKVELDIPPGPHALRLEREGYRGLDTTLTLASGERHRETHRLEKLPESPPAPVKPQVEPVRVAAVDSPKLEQVKNPQAKNPQVKSAREEPLVVKDVPKKDEKKDVKKDAPEKTAPAASDVPDSYFEVTVQGVGLLGRQLETNPASGQPAAALNITGPGDLRMRGFSFELGSVKSYYSWMILGGSLSWAENAWETPMQVTGEPQASLRTFRTSLISVRLLQPQVHFTFWRITTFLQVGLEGRLVLLEGEDDSFKKLYPDGLQGFDLHVNERLGLRARLVEGLYATVAFQMSQSLPIPISALRHSANTAELKGGLGYVF
ncbi:PEGA domain-containing protein [Archangium sp.]|uniref:PEGA domain-containing protein n=1 Tax=Archangium sp. TaxID=1872627 RepID=UPI002ED86012